MSKHTPEPWVFESEPSYCSEIFGSNGESVCTFVDDPSSVDVDRILSCVNACAGMVDPAAEIAELKALSVTSIILDVVPGDGSGLEVYAKSTADVSDFLGKMDEEIDELKRQRDELLEALNMARDYIVCCTCGGPALVGLAHVIDELLDNTEVTK